MTSLNTNHLENTGLRRTLLALLSMSTVIRTEQAVYSCNTTGGWMSVANLDMTDPNQNCPDKFRLVSRTTLPLRTSGRPGPAGCVSTTYPTYWIEYTLKFAGE